MENQQSKLADLYLALKARGNTSDFYDFIRGQIYEIEEFLGLTEQFGSTIEPKQLQ